MSGTSKAALVLVLGGVVTGCTADRGKVVVDVGGAAAFVSYRDGDDAWQTPRFVDSGSYELEVVDDFEIVAVFVGPGSVFHARELAATRHENDHWSLTEAGSWFASPAGDGTSSLATPHTRSCNNGGPGVRVNGQMAQPGEVSISPSCWDSATPDWPFSLFVAAGPHDVIATASLSGRSSPPTVAIRRGVAIADGTTLPAIDVAREGAPLATIPLAVAGLAGFDRLVITTTLVTSTDAGSLGGVILDAPLPASIAAPVLPASLLAPTDRQQLEVATGPGLVARTELTDGEPTIDFPLAPEVMFSVLGDADVVRWYYPLSPRWEVIGLGLEDLDGSDSSQEVYATRGWLAARQAVSLAFDTSASGFEPAWMVDRVYTYSPRFAAFDYATPVKYETVAYP